MRKGRCTCGNVEYELQGEPLFVNCCHCTWCQRETGSAFVINAIYETENVKVLKGEIEKKLIPSESGRGQQLHRCKDCGITLWSNYGGPYDFSRYVRVGTLDNPSDLPPMAHIFVRSKQKWIKLSPEIPAFEIFYDYEKMWTPQNLKKRKDIIEKIEKLKMLRP